MRYIVEHLEGPVEEWCRLEYIHMCQTIGPHRLLFARFPLDGPDAFKVATKSDYNCETVISSLEEIKGSIDWDRTCLLDMDADLPLSCEDGKKFDNVVFGGILGNVPSDDRTSEVRQFGFTHRRHLGEIQMTTNTSMLVAKLVLEDRVPLSSIPYIDHPEVFVSSKESVELPFRYIDLSFFTKRETDKGVPTLPDGMVDFLRSEESCNLDL